MADIEGMLVLEAVLSYAAKSRHCAVCEKPVEYSSVYRNFDGMNWIVTSVCHGSQESLVITDTLLRHAVDPTVIIKTVIVGVPAFRSQVLYDPDEGELF